MTKKFDEFNKIKLCFDVRDLTPDTTHLYLSNRCPKLKEIPMEILTYTSLRYIELSNNDIEYIPESIVGLSKLEYLNLKGNRIKSITPYISMFFKNIEIKI